MWRLEAGAAEHPQAQDPQADHSVVEVLELVEAVGAALLLGDVGEGDAGDHVLRQPGGKGYLAQGVTI